MSILRAENCLLELMVHGSLQCVIINPHNVDMHLIRDTEEIVSDYL